MKKSLRKSGDARSLAEIKELIRKQTLQLAELRTGIPLAGVPEQAEPTKVSGNFLKNYLKASVGDARQCFNSALFGVLGFALLGYYLRHMNTVWIAGILAILTCIPLFGAWHFLSTFWRERKLAEEAGGALAVYNIQFIFGLIFALAGVAMFIFRDTTPLHAASDAHVSFAIMIFGASAMAYNYVLGKRCARRMGRTFPNFGETMRKMNGKRLAQSRRALH